MTSKYVFSWDEQQRIPVLADELAYARVNRSHAAHEKLLNSYRASGVSVCAIKAAVVLAADRTRNLPEGFYRVEHGTYVFTGPELASVGGATAYGTTDGAIVVILSGDQAEFHSHLLAFNRGNYPNSLKVQVAAAL